MTLNLTANGTEQTVIKEYLEQNASGILAEKINNGVIVEQDGKKLLNKKTLDGFMKFANEEARKQAEKGANCACVRDDVVFGWAIHYFEEESIIGTLYNEDGSEYKKAKPVTKKATNITTATPVAPVKKEPVGQVSMFDIFDEPTEKATEPPTIDEEAKDKQVTTKEANEPVKPSVAPLYEKYLQYQEKYPKHIIAMRIGDFYEIFGEAAVSIAKNLDITLTSRDVGLKERVPLLGFPYHRENEYCEKITGFADLVLIKENQDIQIFAKSVKMPLTVNTKTGEVIEENPICSDALLVAKLYELLGNDIEFVR